MLCKARGAGLSDLRLPRELETLGKIDAARINSASEIRIPRLRGYVKHAELGCVIGLLREWIPSGLELSPDDPDSADISAIPSERRQKWLSQIRRTVDWLHEIGLVWGDGKIRNVVVDKDDNAWLIDFGGGWTKGWVDEDLAGTKHCQLLEGVRAGRMLINDLTNSHRSFYGHLLLQTWLLNRGPDQRVRMSTDVDVHCQSLWIWGTSLRVPFTRSLILRALA
ncbi:hypothetical protein RB594_007373, partial [Gaeumannomyces avenae]